MTYHFFYFYQYITGKHKINKIRIQICIFSKTDQKSFFPIFNDVFSRLAIEGGHAGRSCGIVHQDNALVLDGPDQRSVCTGRFDLAQVDSVRFYLKFGKIDF